MVTMMDEKTTYDCTRVGEKQTVSEETGRIRLETGQWPTRIKKGAL
jgi:hypothetical protein